MSLGNFKETSEDTEANEARETTDNTEKSRNQILETPEDYNDDFESKLDTNDADENKNKEAVDSQEGNEERTSLLDKMRNLFSKKESEEKDKADDNSEDLDSSVDSQQETEKKSWELSPEELQRAREGQSEVAEKARNGEYDKPSEGSDSSDNARGIEHGEDGERTRYSDAQYANEHDDLER